MLGARLHAHRILGARLVDDVERMDAALRDALDLAGPARGYIARLHPVVHDGAVELERPSHIGLCAKHLDEALCAVHRSILLRQARFDNATLWITSGASPRLAFGAWTSTRRCLSSRRNRLLARKKRKTSRRCLWR